MAETLAAPAPNRAVDEAQAISDHDKMRKYFETQKRVKIKVPKDRGEQFVQINGYTFNIAAGFEVMVPEQVAQMLRDAEII
jgi:hypothetical protein